LLGEGSNSTPTSLSFCWMELCFCCEPQDHPGLSILLSLNCCFFCKMRGGALSSQNTTVQSWIFLNLSNMEVSPSLGHMQKLGCNSLCGTKWQFSQSQTWRVFPGEA
jgi:hypothetical protein